MLPMSHVKTKAWTHQLTCTAIGLDQDQFAFFLRMGLGKSKIILDIFSIRKHFNPSLKLIVLVPFVTNLEGWQEQIETHVPHLSYSLLPGSSKDRINEINTSTASIFVLTYAGLTALATKPAPKPIPKKKKQKKQILDHQQIDWFGKQFDMIVCDESTQIKNHTTTIYQICRRLSFLIPYRYLLTGTPFGKNPEDLHSQFYFIDHGETLGQTLGIYREGFFTTKKNFWGGYIHMFNKNKTEVLHKRIQNKSIQYETSECLDLPPQIHSIIHVPQSSEIQDYYKRVHDKYTSEAKEGIQLENHFIRLRQISSGFLKYTSEAGEEVCIDFDVNPKLEVLKNLLNEMPSDSKAVVFNFFIHTGELISAALKSEKIKHARIWSGTKNKQNEMKRFKQNPQCRVMVLNEKIGSLGLNLQVANYLIFYEPPVPPIVREQAEGRCRRPGQKKTVFVYDLLMKGSVDQQIYSSAKEGKNLLAEVLAGRASLFPE
jgi:SNF2 family DNA or RNA helicase